MLRPPRQPCQPHSARKLGGRFPAGWGLSLIMPRLLLFLSARICFSARRTVDGQSGNRCRGVRGCGEREAEEGRSAPLTPPRAANFRQEDAVAARFMRTSVVRANDSPLRFAKFFSSGLLRKRTMGQVSSAPRRGVPEAEERAVLVNRGHAPQNRSLSWPRLPESHGPWSPLAEKSHVGGINLGGCRIRTSTSGRDSV